MFIIDNNYLNSHLKALLKTSPGIKNMYNFEAGFLSIIWRFERWINILTWLHFTKFLMNAVLFLWFWYKIICVRMLCIFKHKTRSNLNLVSENIFSFSRNNCQKFTSGYENLTNTYAFLSGDVFVAYKCYLKRPFE